MWRGTPADSTDSQEGGRSARKQREEEEEGVWPVSAYPEEPSPRGGRDYESRKSEIRQKVIRKPIEGDHSVPSESNSMQW